MKAKKMKPNEATYNNKKVYISYSNFEEEYSLVTYDPKLEGSFFKVDNKDLRGYTHEDK